MLLQDIVLHKKHIPVDAIASDAELSRQIQTRLIALKLLTPPADGKFGPRSMAALKDFQTIKKLTLSLDVLEGLTAKALIECKELPMLSGLEKYTKGKPYLLATFTGKYDQYGFKSFLLQFVNGGKVVDQLNVISGSPTAQRRELPRPEDDYSGSGNPCPEGIYKIGQVIRMTSPEKGVGYVKIPIDVLGEFRVNNRSELLLHDDENRSYAIGSLGCFVTYTKQDMSRIVGWCEQKARPENLIVDFGKGLLRQRGIKVEL